MLLPVRKLIIPGLAALSILGGGCSGTGDDDFKGDGSPVLARVDKSYLTLNDVRNDLPGGLSAEDSARFVKGYVHNWVDNHLMQSMAEDEIDMEDINRLVEQYKTSLIAEAYRRKIFAGANKDLISEDSLRSYYESHRDEYKLRTPMVKGVYIKIPAEAQNVQELRKLIVSDKDEDIDKLEKEVIKSNAIHYDYFRDRWIDWDQIESRIPYPFETEKQFLEPGNMLNTLVDNHLYLLRITDVLQAGETMPFEAARNDILEKFLVEQRRQLDMAFRAELLERALSTGRAEINVQ